MCIDCESLWTFYNLDTLKDRRNRLCKVFIEKNVHSESGRLSYLQPSRRDLCDNLRRQLKYRFNGLTGSVH